MSIIHGMTGFWERVDTSAECWEWLGSRTSGGYGNLRVDGRNDYAHRVSYRLTYGSIPDGLVIDHLCRNRACVRPDHLEAVSAGENVRRGAAPYGPIRHQCKHGHDITDATNVYTAPDGSRRCRVCASERDAERKRQRQARGDLRKVLATHCIRGHRFDAANTYVTPAGHQKCRACNAAHAAARRRAAS